MRSLFTLALLVALVSPAAVAQSEMKPFLFDHRGAANSAIDLSFLLDAPAGTIEYRSIFAVGLTLFVVTMFLNILAQWFIARVREKYE